MSGSLMVMIGVVSILALQVASPLGDGEKARRGDGATVRKGTQRRSCFLSLLRPVALSPRLPRRSFVPALDDQAPHRSLYAVAQQPEGQYFYERSYFFYISSSRAAQERSWREASAAVAATR